MTVLGLPSLQLRTRIVQDLPRAKPRQGLCSVADTPGVQGGAVPGRSGALSWSPAQGSGLLRGARIQDWGEIRGGVRGLVGVGPLPVVLQSCPGGGRPMAASGCDV